MTDATAPDPNEMAADALAGRGFSFRWRALGEAAVIIVALIGLDRLLGGSHRFLGLEPHPFGAAVLLAAAQYGAVEGASVAALASVALLAFNLPDQTFGQDHQAWLAGVALDPLLWFASALVIGSLGGRARGRALRAEAVALQRNEQVAEVVAANEGLSARIKVLETRIAGQQRTVTSVYEAARSMGPGRESVLRGGLALLRAAIGATHTSLFLLEEGALVLAGSDGEGTPAVTSLRRGKLYEAIVGAQRSLFAHRTEDQEALGSVGVMAGPLLTREGGVRGALIVNSLPLAQFNLGAVANFRAIAEWIAAELEQAASYEAAQESSFLVEGSNLVSSRYADRLIRVMTATAHRVGFELSLMQVDFLGDPADPASHAARTELLGVLETILRNTDTLIDEGGGRGVQALLPGTPLTDSHLVAARLRKAVEARDPALLQHFALSWVGLNQTKPSVIAA